MTHEAERFEMPRRVDPSEVDALGHVNNVVYLQWVQDVAIAHWTTAASPEAQAELFWVVARHEIDYLRPVMPDDEIVLRTWVGTATDRRFDRHTEIVRARDGKVCARARTEWCPMSRVTGRPTDVGDAVRARFSVPG